MQVLQLLSGVIILFFGIFLVGLAVTIVVKPRVAERFLGSFASSARAHFTEQIARLIVGIAMVNFSPSMRFPEVFLVFGWILVVTSIALMLIPWQWHHKYGEWVIPLAIRFMKVFALGAFLLGIFVFYGLSRVAVS